MMRRCYDMLRTTLAITLLLAVTILPIALARAPQQPAVDAASVQDRPDTGALRLPRLVAQASAASMGSADDDTVTVGPKSAPRMHGGSVLTDFLSQ
jgi:hypothetical protein